MPRSFSVFCLLLTLSGCVTPEQCADRQFFKPRIIGGDAAPNRYFPGVAEFRLHEDLTLRLSVCDRAGANVLCIEIYPAEDVAFQFSEPRVTVSPSVSGPKVDLPIARITYNISCHGPTSNDSECESSRASPLLGAGQIEMSTVRATKIGGNVYFTDAYSFSPESAFKGASVTASFLMKIHRKYEAITEALRQSPNEEFYVALPRVRIGSHELDVPQVAFKFVTENVCLPNRPLSLQ
jgi:hypothetical protein